MISTEVLIIGGGLAGLALADHFENTGIDYRLVEARARFGGRIKVLSSNAGDFDLGPSWFWPGQPRMAAVAQRFGVPVFEQFATGAVSYENERGEVQRDQGWSSMQGSLRLEGGMAKLIDGFVQALPDDRLILNQKIARVVYDGKTVGVFDPNSGLVARSKKVVLALPPRIASQMIFEPALPETAQRALASISTWMAGHAKFVAVYNTPFWRADGLTGDAMSRHGPMIEMHDASDPRTGHGAIFGFLGVPARVRNGQNQAIIDACIAQLTRIFGDQAQSPLQVYLQDWAFEPETAIEADHTPPAGHPHYGLPSALSNLWDSKLTFASTEAAPQFGGFLEGALEAAENAFRHVSAAHLPSAG